MIENMPLYDLRQRRAMIRDKLLAIGLQLPLPCDAMFEKGWLHEVQWSDFHCFRYDQVMLLASQAKGEAPRKRRRDVKSSGFRMPNAGITRADQCRVRMDAACYDVAMILVGLAEGNAERMEALNAAWQVGQIYRGNGGIERWRD